MVLPAGGVAAGREDTADGAQAQIEQQPVQQQAQQQAQQAQQPQQVSAQQLPRRQPQTHRERMQVGGGELGGAAEPCMLVLALALVQPHTKQRQRQLHAPPAAADSSKRLLPRPAGTLRR
jgi:hypothetical protein